MSRIDEGLYSYLSGLAPLSALVQGRIWPQRARETTCLPYVIYDRSGDERPHTMGSDTAPVRSTFLFHCYGGSYDSAHDVAEQIQNALNHYGGQFIPGVIVSGALVQSITDDYNDEAPGDGAYGAHRALVIAEIWHFA